MKNRIAVITGASTGIGRAISIAFAKEGAIVLLNARSSEKLNEAVKEIRKSGGKGEAFPFDLRNFKSIQAFAKKIKKKYGRVDIIVNVAGIYHGKKKFYSNINFEDYSVDEILETYDVGITAPTLLCHQLVPMMKSGSKIINISGTFESGAKGWLPYYVSKKAIEDLTIGLSEELKVKGIQVNCISPSDTLTESYKKFFPEFAKEEICILPEDVARLAVSFAEKSNNATGEIRVIKK